MRIARGWAVAAVVAAGATSMFGVAADAAQPPEVYAVVEGVNADGGRMLIVTGNRLTKAKKWILETAGPSPEEVGSIVPSLRSRTLAVLEIPAALVPGGAFPVPGDYGLRLLSSAGADLTMDPVPVRITLGYVDVALVRTEALDDALREDLADADTLQGRAGPWYTDADNVDAGTLATARYRARDSLQSHGDIGTGSTQVAAGNDVRFPPAPGSAGRMLYSDGSAWTALSPGSNGQLLTLSGGVPAWTSSSVPAPLSVTINGATESSAAITGTTTNEGIGVVGRASDATETGKTFGVKGIADGQAGRGVHGEATNTGATLRNFGVIGRAAGGRGIGVFAQALRDGTSDFDPSPGGAPGPLTDLANCGVCAGATGTDSCAIYAENTDLGGGASYALFALAKGAAGTAIYARGGTGIRAEARSSDTFAVYANGGFNGANSTGVYGVTSAGPGAGAFKRAGVVGGHVGGSGAGFGVRGLTDSSQGTGIYAEASSASGAATAFQADLSAASASGTIARFTVAGTNVARIDSTGKGYFNGNVVSSGADVAECVAVDRPKAEFEPGDVLVIDSSGARRFALSREANSRLVAGVYATRPGLLLRNGPVADGEASAGEEVPLAVVGIVPVKVCDEGGPVGAGDLLVAASLPGHAMRAPEEPRAGTVLGKSLGRLDRGTGKVEVLLGPAR